MIKINKKLSSEIKDSWQSYVQFNSHKILRYKENFFDIINKKNKILIENKRQINYLQIVKYSAYLNMQ